MKERNFVSSCRGRHPVRGEVHSPEARITSNSWTITPLSSRYLSASALSDHLPRALPTRRTIYPQVVTVSARRFIDRRKRLSTGGWEASPVPFSGKEQNFRSAAADRTRPVYPRQRAGAQFPVIVVGIDGFLLRHLWATFLRNKSAASGGRPSSATGTRRRAWLAVSKRILRIVNWLQSSFRRNRKLFAVPGHRRVSITADGR